MIHALKYTKKLEQVGFSADQAKTAVQIWMELMDQNFATRADFKEYYFMTRNDLINLKIEIMSYVDERLKVIDERFKSNDEQFKLIDQRFNAIEKRLDIIEAKFETLENKLVIKLGIMMAASITIITAIISLK